jgi:hypothetical protein
MPDPFQCQEPTPAAPAAPSAASRYREKLLAWEQNALVGGEKQLHCVEVLRQLRTSEQPPSSLVSSLVGAAATEHDSGARAGTDKETRPVRDGCGDVEERGNEQTGIEGPSSPPRDTTTATAAAALPQTKESFHSWFADTGAKVEARRGDRYSDYLQSLSNYHDACKLLAEQSSGVLERLDSMQGCYRTVQTKTREVHEQCDSLLREKSDLVAYADAIRAKLKYFDELDQIGASFSVATVDIVDDPQFLDMLERLDECIAYVSCNPQFQDADDFAAKFRELQARGLAFIAEKFDTVLREVTAHVLPEVQRSMSAADEAEAVSKLSDESLLYAKYRAVADPMKELMSEIGRRRATNELCTDMLLDCQTSYLHIRQTVVGDIVHTNLEAMRDQFSTDKDGTDVNSAELSMFARQGWHYMMSVCELEFKLWNHFFPDGTPTEGLRELVQAYNMLLYDYLRPMYIRESTFEELVDCLHVLKNELLQDEMGRRGLAASFCRPTIQRSIQDLQEKLIFLTQTYVRDEIETFEPSSVELDYPAILQEKKAAESGDESAPDTMFRDGWYPPLRRCLLCLSKLYRCLEGNIFAELAHEAVAVTTLSLLDASEKIALESGEIHGQLFVVKHLLTLREQIQPFNVDFSSQEAQLNFDSTRLTVMRLVTDVSTSYRPPSAAQLMDALTTGAPVVVESHSDSKVALERALRAACEDFIQSATKTLAGPLLAFIAKLASLDEDASGDSVPSIPADSFVHPAKLKQLLADVDATMQRVLPELQYSMVTYLPNVTTRAIIFRPIRSHVVDAYAQLQQTISRVYSPSDLISLHLPSSDDIERLVDTYAASPLKPGADNTDPEVARSGEPQNLPQHAKPAAPEPEPEPEPEVGPTAEEAAEADAAARVAAEAKAKEESEAEAARVAATKQAAAVQAAAVQAAAGQQAATTQPAAAAAAAAEVKVARAAAHAKATEVAEAEAAHAEPCPEPESEAEPQPSPEDGDESESDSEDDEEAQLMERARLARMQAESAFAQRVQEEKDNAEQTRLAKKERENSKSSSWFGWG